MAVGDSPSSSSGTTLSASYRLSASGRLLLPLLSPPLLVAVLLAASLPLPAGCLPAPRLTLPAPCCRRTRLGPPAPRSLPAAAAVRPMRIPSGRSPLGCGPSAAHRPNQRLRGPAAASARPPPRLALAGCSPGRARWGICRARSTRWLGPVPPPRGAAAPRPGNPHRPEPLEGPSWRTGFPWPMRWRAGHGNGPGSARGAPSVLFACPCCGPPGKQGLQHRRFPPQRRRPPRPAEKTRSPAIRIPRHPSLLRRRTLRRPLAASPSEGPRSPPRRATEAARAPSTSLGRGPSALPPARRQGAQPQAQSSGRPAVPRAEHRAPPLPHAASPSQEAEAAGCPRPSSPPPHQRTRKAQQWPMCAAL
uniref:Uncharacterized protein n=2 Tax=Tetraselmis sp. GSL018 TaxID=582737 RepID=A0A061RTQ2_9CHLO